MQVRALGVSLILLVGLIAGLGSPAAWTGGADAATPSASPSASPSDSAGPSATSTPASTAVTPASKSATSSPSKSASSTPSKSASPTKSPSPGPATKTGNFVPAKGALFNDPYNRSPYKNDTIRVDAVRSINSAPPGSVIRMAMFNFKSQNYLDALINAHKRGVQVQFLMCSCNNTKAINNPQPAKLRSELNKGNSKLPAAKKSWVKECRGSCRGRQGINHFKFITISRVDPKKPIHDVVMYGSNNATEVAVNRQWNDWFTFTGDPRMFNDLNAIFEQASRDKAIKNAYVEHNFGGYAPKASMWVYPYTGAGATGDPVIKKLNKIACTGTTLPNLHGHTRVRVAQDAIAGARGIEIAQKLASMEKKGCDVRIVYTLMGDHVLNILSRAGIRTVHYAYDRNGDGEYDMYLHAKDLAVEGTYAGDKQAYVTWNGTANWTPLPLQSDEIVAEIHDRKTTIAYTRWINWLLTHRPASWPAGSSTGGSSADIKPDMRASVNPYAAIRGDL